MVWGMVVRSLGRAKYYNINRFAGGDQNAIEGLKYQRADKKNGEKIFPAKFALAIAIAVAIAVAFIAISNTTTSHVGMPSL